MHYSTKKLKAVTESNQKKPAIQRTDIEPLQSSEYSELHSFIKQYQQRHYSHQLQAELLGKRSERSYHECKKLLSQNSQISIHK